MLCFKELSFNYNTYHNMIVNSFIGSEFLCAFNRIGHYHLIFGLTGTSKKDIVTTIIKHLF